MYISSLMAFHWKLTKGRPHGFRFVGYARTSGNFGPMLLRVLCLTFVGSLAGLGSTVKAEDEKNSSAELAVYSDLNFIELEREFVGLQIAIVPDRDGQKVLWRSAGPFMNAPLLLDAVKTGNTLKVTVPDGDQYKGVWNLTLSGKVIYAAGPEGQKYSLKRINLK